MQLGIETFIKEKKWQRRLENRRIAFLGHTASVNKNLQSSLYLIQSNTPLKISCLFGPQHGFKGTQQANMVTTEDEYITGQTPSFPFSFPVQNASIKQPVFSLYSNKTRRLTKEMLSYFDVLICDLQDVGCRVYTYLTTLLYIMEDLNCTGKELWILDRPNPAGRSVEGSILNSDFFSFVGAAPLPIRHGMTLGELSLWYRDLKQIDLTLEVIQMRDYQMKDWPFDLPWVLPSPNMVDEECTRIYSGTVLLEGTHISEARGTVFPLKAFGIPDMDASSVLKLMQKLAPEWLQGCALRIEFFKPVFDKFKNQTCSSIRIYAVPPFYKGRDFQPFRIVSLFLKCFKQIHSDFAWILPPPYEYEYKKLPIDILSGDDFLRGWIEDSHSSISDLEDKLSKDEDIWKKQRKRFLLY